MRKKLGIDFKRDLGLILIINIIAYFAWSFLPTVTIRSDGFLYMLARTYKQFVSIPYFYTSYQNSGMLFGFIFSKLFGVKIELYFWAELAVMLLINVLFYLLVKVVTKKRIIAFSASLMFAVSYFGLWDMFTNHCYCFFLERPIVAILLLPSFTFLHLFLQYSKRKYLAFSLILYFLAIGLAHFAILFTGLYLAYPFFYRIFERNTSKRRIINGLVYGLSYLLISGFFVLLQQKNESGFGPHNWTFLGFLTHPQLYGYPEKMLLQLVYWIQYPTFLRNFDLAANPLQNLLDIKFAHIYIPYVLALYTICSVIIFKTLPKFRALLFSVIFGVSWSFYLNAYFGQYDILTQSGSSRYLYYPSFLLVIFWSLFFWSIFWSRKNTLYYVGFFPLGLYVWINIWLITSHVKWITKWDASTKAIQEYLIENRGSLKKNTLVIGPYPEIGIQEATFFTEQLGMGQVKYMSENTNYDNWKDEAPSFSYVIKVSYDGKCDCVVEEKIK